MQRNSIDVEGKAVKLTPGMLLTAEVKTGRRAVIDFLISPLRARVEESLKGR